MGGAILPVHTETGKKIKCIYGKTRKEVAAKLAKAIADREAGLVFDAGSLAIGEYLGRCWIPRGTR